MKVKGSSRARGGNRGGVGGGYERTDDCYEEHKMQRMRRDLLALGTLDRQTYLAGLSRFERRVLEQWLREQDGRAKHDR